jgi:2-polyprenyl-3-methyl-5-hydroxy-6-metoxy-1,4-benzoquinol methylase
MNPIQPSNTDTNSSKEIASIPSEYIIGLYKSKFNVDVARFFTGLSQVKIMQDTRTGYRYYYPLQLGGDGKFYEALSVNDFYYMPWKWEYTIAESIIPSKGSVLEIGCGNGAFLEKLHLRGNQVTGLEINEEQVGKLQAKNLHVLNESLHGHKSRAVKYDYVVSFQVLEHIALVHDYFQDCLDLLNPGGKVIFCVPNNDSFIQYNFEYTLNMPPHHMGLWTEESIVNLASIFPMKFERFYIEPLQSYHFNFYTKCISCKYSRQPILRKALLALMTPFMYVYLLFNAKNIKGQSILAVFTKN